MTLSNEAEGARPGLVLSAIGPDRRGIVNEISSYVARCGGNIEDTRMSKLGGEFALLVLITGTEAELSAIENAIPSLSGSSSLHCFTKRTSAALREKSRSYRLEASGLDHPGIVARVTEVLAAENVNVTSFASRLENAPLSGTLVFLLDAELEIPGEADVVELEKRLAEICESEQLEFILNQA